MSGFTFLAWLSVIFEVSSRVVEVVEVVMQAAVNGSTQLKNPQYGPDSVAHCIT